MDKPEFSLLVFFLLFTPVLTFSSSNSKTSVFSLASCENSYKNYVSAKALCGFLSVSEEPGNPKSKTLHINLLKIPALRKTREDPLFIIVGGPGGAAVQSAAHYIPYFRRLGKTRDVVFVDQRGTGESNPLNCKYDTNIYSSEKEEREALSREHAQACITSLDANLQYYTTSYAVHDLEQVRQALGYKKINLWGVSYGTRVILEYLRLYPQSIRSVVLDGLAPVSIQLPHFVAVDGSRSLERIFTACEADRDCREAFGDLKSVWLALLQKLDDTPERITLTNPRSLAKRSLNLTPDILSSWVRTILYDRNLVPILPMSIYKAAQGDYRVLGGLFLLSEEKIGEQVSHGMQLTVLCTEDMQFPRANDQYAHVKKSDRETLLWLDSVQNLSTVCEYFAQEAPPNAYYLPLSSDVPALLLSGGFDPVTPPTWGERVAKAFSNVKHIVVAGAHHGVTMQGCVSDLVKQFVEQGDAGLLDASCVENIKPKPFFIDSAGPRMARHVGEKREEKGRHD